MSCVGGGEAERAGSALSGVAGGGRRAKVTQVSTYAYCTEGRSRTHPTPVVGQVMQAGEGSAVGSAAAMKQENLETGRERFHR